MGRTRRKRKDLPERMYLHGNRYRYIPVVIVDGKRRNGKPIDLGPKTSLGDALRAYARIVDRPEAVRTLGHAMTVYERSADFAELKPSTQTDYRYILSNLRTAFGDNHPDDLTIQDLHKYGYARGGGKRVHREIAVLSNVYKTAIKTGAATQNPCVFWEYEASKPRTRYPSDEELETFKTFCRNRFKDELTPLYVDLKRLIGLRLNNMLSIRRTMIKEDGLHPGTSKRGRPQVFVYIDADGRSTGLKEALDAIVALPRPASSMHLFSKRDATPYTVEGFQSNWQRRMNAYVKDTVAERFWEHDIRAAAGTAADEAMQEVRRDPQSLLGHSQQGTTNRYLRGRAAVKVLPAPKPKGSS
jgi:integrase